MPHAISCPVCGVDGTALADHLLIQQASTPAAAAPLPIVTPVTPIATPAVLEVAPAAPVPAASGVRLSINRPAPASGPPPVPAAISAPSPLSGPKAVPIKPLMKTPIDNPKEFSMGLGILGALLGAAIGGGLVFGFAILVGFRFPLTGTAIGALTGLGARWLARGTDSTLGAIAAAIALLSVVGTFFLIYGDFPSMGIITVGVSAYFAYRVAA